MAPGQTVGDAVYGYLEHLVVERGLAGNTVERVVFDPITPLLSGPTQAFATDRFRVLADSIQAMGATALYLIDLPEGQAQAAAAKPLAVTLFELQSVSPLSKTNEP